MPLEVLSADDVERIHGILVGEFAKDKDPISPPGLRSRALLESAVSRQLTGLGGQLKYPDPIDNAATLTYGICNDHAFHNGNKRTAVVAMLAHLDKNRLCLFDVSQDALYEMILAAAAHEIAPSRTPKRFRGGPSRPVPDDEVAAIAAWIRRGAKRLQRGEKEITYRELRRILRRFAYDLINPDSNTIDVVRYITETRGLLRRETRTVSRHVGSIPYPGDAKIVGIRHIKYVRGLCNLTELDGVDTDSFYDEGAVIDGFVNKYRTLLRRLARK